MLALVFRRPSPGTCFKAAASVSPAAISSRTACRRTGAPLPSPQDRSDRVDLEDALGQQALKARVLGFELA